MGRLVLRRNAANRIEDHAVNELEPVVPPAVIDARGEAELDERAIKKLACVVARKGAPRPVGPAQTRRKTDDGDACIGFAEGRNRRVPPVREGNPVRGPEGREPRTIRAIVGWADVECHAAIDALLAHFLGWLLDRGED